MQKQRVLVAMSGGVDSAVAAARLVDDGYDVVGVTLHLWDYPEDEAQGHGRCCAPEDQYDARRVADFLGFPHFTFDRRELFAREVVQPFVESYGAGVTPSPCSACNRTVKLRELGVLADRLQAGFVATGHYARVGRAGEAPTLLAGLDPQKDQSYFLYATPPALLARMLFPLGESDKKTVRAEALARRLPGASKGESQELCFVGAGAHAYTRFVEERLDESARKRGPVLDKSGVVVGHHDGVHRFTVGQRKGLKIALGRPAFVTAIDPDSGAVQLGDPDDLLAGSAALDDLVLAPNVELPLTAQVRVRYRHGGVRARVESTQMGANITFLEPVRAVAAGQIAVFYDGDRVLGGGRILSSNRAEAA